jgi:hypothetical protein
VRCVDACLCDPQTLHCAETPTAPIPLTTEPQLPTANCQIRPLLPSYAGDYTVSVPFTRIRDIAHRSDIPKHLKDDIKHNLQNKLHRSPTSNPETPNPKPRPQAPSVKSLGPAPPGQTAQVPEPLVRTPNPETKDPKPETKSHLVKT